ncbi:hypothetical protein Tco_1122327 [Tanacetum coccineum]|uniref:CCHC-type domain-containing protein n=1 Tax=Tanacetum coccineum TaxID=301880 RepID=A0ABQ5J2J3_9ASTR
MTVKDLISIHNIIQNVEFPNIICILNSSNALHNDIDGRGSKDRPLMLAPEIHHTRINGLRRSVPVAEGALLKHLQSVNVQFLLQLQPEWQRFVTLVKQSQELKTVFYHKLYDILKQHQNEVNEIRAERLARTANPLALVSQQQPVYHHQNHHTQNTQYSSTRSQQSTRNKGKSIKIYKPTNNNLRTSSNTSRANEDNSPRINKGTGYDNQRAVNVAGARENVGTPVVQKFGIQCYNCKEYGHGSWGSLMQKQADWKIDTDDEFKDQELEVTYMYMAQASKRLIMMILVQERELLASLIQKQKCEIDGQQKHENKFLESSKHGFS